MEDDNDNLVFDEQIWICHEEQLVGHDDDDVLVHTSIDARFGKQKL
jgi:2C-methyl-D-erythritol 2,4-cyclodiphosphate synthase